MVWVRAQEHNLYQCLCRSSIRYAAPPIGDLRFRAPVEPEHTGSWQQADDFGPPCLQSSAPGVPLQLPTRNQSEDCLFLNVYAPDGGHGLPIYVFIHGGGYGQGDGSKDGGQDLTALINDNENSFIGVSLNYRVRKLSGDLQSAKLLTPPSLGPSDSSPRRM
jgi:carboxylesterase type B